LLEQQAALRVGASTQGKGFEIHELGTDI